MLPANWKATELGEIAKFSSGGTPSKENADFWGGVHPWITAKDLKQHYLKNSIDTLTDAGVANAKLAPAGASLILVRGMTLLKDFPVGYVTRPMSFNQDIKALIPEKEVDGLFLSFFLASQKEKMRQLVSIAGHGTGRLDTESIKSVPLNLPSLGEQKKIAKILVAWDQAITATEKLLANSQQQKRALMQFLLTGKLRLNGFSGIQWKEYRLGKLFNERIENNQLDLPLVSITREQGVIWRDDVGRKDTSSEDKTKYLRICPCDIGYNTMRMWQGVSALSAIEGLVSPAYTVITPKHGVDGLFMSYLFKLQRTIHNFYRYSQGLTSDTWNLKFRHFKEVTVTIPVLEEQKQIAKILQKCDREIAGLIAMREALVSEKKALMQQLLTGKRRVKVD
jgi:type I restriction enzyme S subunit